jgi:hypothetical protein
MMMWIPDHAGRKDAELVDAALSLKDICLRLVKKNMPKLRDMCIKYLTRTEHPSPLPLEVLRDIASVISPASVARFIPLLESLNEDLISDEAMDKQCWRPAVER